MKMVIYIFIGVINIHTCEVTGSADTRVDNEACVHTLKHTPISIAYQSTICNSHLDTASIMH